MKKYVLLFLLMATSVFAEVITELKSFKMVKNSEGQMEKMDVEQSSPGDVISYEFYIKNDTDEVIYNLGPIIPIPDGTTLIPNTIEPTNDYKVSVNGQDFVSYPVMVDDVMISNGEYRAVTWEIPQLDKGVEVNLELQVRINTPN